MIGAVTEGDNTQYTTAILKGGALVAEMRILLQYWQPGQTHQELIDAIQQSDALGKPTSYRTLDLVNRVFRPRFLIPDDRAARALKLLLALNGDNSTFRELLLLHTARADRLIYDFVLAQFWPACRSGALVISIDDVMLFFDEARRNRHIAHPWTEQVRIKSARGILSTLRDFGFIREETKGRREIVSYRPSDIGLAYLAYELHFQGLPDAMMVEHTDWSLFGLDRTHVLVRLEVLDSKAGLLMQRAGSVVRITWSHPSMESLIHAFA